MEARKSGLAVYLKQLLDHFPRILETSTLDSFLDLHTRLASEIVILVRTRASIHAGSALA